MVAFRISLFTVTLLASASATWKPIVGPVSYSSSSLNKNIPYTGDTHTYYGNEFLSEYASLGDDHLIVPNLGGHSPVIGSDSVSSFGHTKHAELSVRKFAELIELRGKPSVLKLLFLFKEKTKNNQRKLGYLD